MTRLPIWRGFALSLSILLAAEPLAAADTTVSVRNLAARLACHQKAMIVAFGSSSIEGIGASSPSKNFPSLLPGEIHKLEPNGPDVTVLNRGIRGEDVDNMIARLDRDVIAPGPDTVIWQLGTNDAISDMPLPHFLLISRQVIERIKAAGIDVVLMEPQRTPVADAAVHAKDYLDAIRALGRDEHLLVIPRYGWMIGWLSRYGNSIVASDRLHMSDLGYALLTRAVAKLLVDQVKLDVKANPTPNCAALASQRPT